MPLRKRKGRRKPKSPASRQAKEDTPDVIPDEAKDVVETEGGAQPKRASTRSETLQTVGDGSGDGEMDEEERRARETIALLAKKYQVRLSEESSHSLDIIRVDDAEAAQYKAEEVEKENKRQPRSPLSSRKAPRPISKRTKLQKQQKASADVTSDTHVFKIPKPLTNHSTPAPSGNRSLFGFEELDSPLTLSPVTTATPVRGHSSLSVAATSIQRASPEESTGSKLIKPSPYSRLKGTYDIPFKKKTPKRQLARRKKSFGGEDRWAEKLNAQFTEIEQFELAVE